MCCRKMVLIAMLSAFCAASAAAQEFRVETDVFVGEEPEATSHAVTLFEKSAVYEFTENPQQIVVYRAADGDRAAEFILLDPQSQRRTEVEVAKIKTLMGKLAKWAGEQQDPVLKFAANPKFDEKFNEESGELTLSSKEWTYRIATVPAENQAALTRYRDFADRYAELSTMLHGAVPPAARQALDAALVKHKAIPVEIRRTTGGDEKNQVRAAHLFSWRLSREDRSRLDDAQKYLASFKKVDNEKFLTAVRGTDRDKTVVRGQSR